VYPVVEAVSFDIWGTLLDLGRYYAVVARKLSELSGRPAGELYRLTLEVYREALRARLEGSFRRVVLDSAEFFAARLGVQVEDLFTAVVTSVEDPEVGGLAYPDAAESLEVVRSSGYRVAALGNVMFWPGMLTRYMLYRCGLLRYFHLTVFSDEVGLNKPSREIFDYVAQKLGVRLGALVHVGDSVENDLAGAVVAGAKAVLVNREAPVPKLRLSRGAYLVNSLKHLPEVLKELT
jgi:putative hydrolase of the HAD superfamily